jgi:hypothetical protein
VGKLKKRYVKLEVWQTSFKVVDNSDICYCSVNEIRRSQQLIPLLVSKTTRFDVQVNVHRDKFLLIKLTRCTYFSNLFLE